jgi:maleate isomerase/arylmalonate decarboxylase
VTWWIGRIEPSMWFEGPSWDALLPADVRVGVLSLGIGRLVPSEIERAHGQILEKVALLEREGVDVINVGGSPVVSAYGRDGHARLLEDIAGIVTRPFVSSLQAELEALRALGAGSVAIASPYPLGQTARRVALLEEEGFRVLGHDSLDIERNREIAMLDPELVVRQAVQVAERWPAADVLYLPCGSLPVVEVIDRIEAVTGRPVVTNVQAQANACLRRLPYPEPITGYGRLLASTA